MFLEIIEDISNTYKCYVSEIHMNDLLLSGFLSVLKNHHYLLFNTGLDS